LLAASNFAWQLLRNGKLEEAERLSREGLETARRVLGEEHSRTLMLMNILGLALRARGDNAAAEPLLVKNLEFRRRVSGEEHPHTRNAMSNLADLYEDQQKFDQAEPLRVERVEITRRVLGAEYPELAFGLAQLGGCRLQQQKFTEAEPVLRECLAIREKSIPDNWLTPNAKWLLGRALLGQKKYTDAEPFLLAGYEGLKQREAKIPPQFRERPILALRTLVQLYEAWEKPDEAAKWRQKLEAPNEAAGK
jgi:tetratricopeptide (TPR) repeat protein